MSPHQTKSSSPHLRNTWSDLLTNLLSNSHPTTHPTTTIRVYYIPVPPPSSLLLTFPLPEIRAVAHPLCQPRPAKPVRYGKARCEASPKEKPNSSAMATKQTELDTAARNLDLLHNKNGASNEQYLYIRFRKATAAVRDERDGSDPDQSINQTNHPGIFNTAPTLY